MKILENIEIKDLGLFIGDILVIADTHIGYEESLNKQGVLIPRFQFKEIIDRLERIMKGKRFSKIIINGDVKHEFGRISEQEWRHSLRLLDFLSKYCDEVVLVKGNHDTILGPIAEKRKVKVVDFFRISDILVVHGDKLVKDLKGVKTIIIGHEHPAFSVRDELRSELFKCFLKGKWKRKNLIVMPSFNLVTEGTDVLKEGLLSPFLQKSLDKFEVFVVGDKVYRFGKVNLYT